MTIYLDNAATSFPKPAVVYEQIRPLFEEFGACPGRGSYAMARNSEDVVFGARKVLAQLLGVDEPERIVFTLNASDALNIAIFGTLRSGDHVITSPIEHNSITRPLNALEREGVIEVTRLETDAVGRVTPEQVQKALRPNTRLVALLHASNVNGILQPVEAIGRVVRSSNAYFLVDGAQSVGAYPFDVSQACIDLLAFPGHKALLGPQGTGGLYVHPRVDIRPWRQGGTGVYSEDPFQPSVFPHRLEAGSVNTLGVATLKCAVEWVLRRGVSEIRKHEMALIRKLRMDLAGDDRFTLYGDPEEQSSVAVLSLRVRGWTPSALGDYLDREGSIAVRAGLHCAPGLHRLQSTFLEGTVRISPGIFNTIEDIQRCSRLLKSAADRRPSKALTAVTEA